jgi:hypothetical protein
MKTLANNVLENEIRKAFTQNPYLKWINFKEIEVGNYFSTYRILGLNKIQVSFTIDQYNKSKNVIPLMNDVLRIIFKIYSVYKASIKIYSNETAKRKYELVDEPTSPEKLYFLKNITKFNVNSSVEGRSKVLKR